MKLYNIATDLIEDKKVVTIGDTNVIVDKVTEEVLNSGGYYYISYESPPNKRYYTSTQNKALVDNTYVVGYTAVQKSVSDVQGLMIKDLMEQGVKYGDEATVDTGLGFIVRGREEDLVAFNIGSSRNRNSARDVNGQEHSLNPAQLGDIASLIEDNGMLLYDVKWGKFDEVQLFTTVDECILYEATPYDCPEFDEEGNPTGGTTTCYRNLVKDWEL